MIRDRIGIRTKEGLLQEPGLTLNGAIKKCRSVEATYHQLKEMGESTPKEESVIFAKHHQKKTSSKKCFFSKNVCRYCGEDRHKKREDCHALGVTCRKCGEKNNYAKVCQNEERKHKSDYRRDKKAQSKKKPSSQTRPLLFTLLRPCRHLLIE